MISNLFTYILNEFPVSFIVFFVMTALMIFITKMKHTLSQLEPYEIKNISNKIDEELAKYTSDKIQHGYFSQYLYINDNYDIKICKQEYSFLISYFVCKKYEFKLLHKVQNSTREIVGTYNDIESLVLDYIKYKKEFNVKEKLRNLENDF